MYKKIVWWLKNRQDIPLSYMLTVAAIYCEKLDPKDFYNSNMPVSFDVFKGDCGKPNQFCHSESKTIDQFKTETGFLLSDLISSDLWNEIIKFNTISDYIESRTFNSQEEITKLCKKIYSEYLDEKCFSNIKMVEKIYGKRGTAYVSQMTNLSRNVDVVERWVLGTANQFWFGNNALRCISNRARNLFDVPQSDEKYRIAVISLKESFHFSDLQIEMLKYFCCQSKEETCPASLHKAIYFWGKEKQTGKTTIASIIVSILNGEKDHFNIRNYKSSLAQELGFKDFVAPMICSCRAVMLDEAMPKDSSKSYDTLKERITSDGCKVRFIHKNQITLQAKANYVFTSNHPLSYFIQDESERRFLEFNIEKKYKTLTYKEIYNIFLNFIQQCKRSLDWQEWYDSMSKETEVKGLESKDIEDIKSFFLATNGFATVIKNGGRAVTIGEFYKWVFQFDKNASKKMITECVIDLFGEPYRPSTWLRSQILEVLGESECPF